MYNMCNYLSFRFVYIYIYSYSDSYTGRDIILHDAIVHITHIYIYI